MQDNIYLWRPEGVEESAVQDAAFEALQGDWGAGLAKLEDEVRAAPNNTEALEAAGVDPVKAVAEAESAKIGKALQVETDLAMDLGVFGAPSFVVEGEVFWGDDRLEDAISWLHNGRVTLPQA